MSLANLPSLVIGEILQYLRVPDLAALCATSKALRHHVHPLLYLLAHDYCTFKDNLAKKAGLFRLWRVTREHLAVTGPPAVTRQDKLRTTFTSNPHYARLTKTHCVRSQGLFTKMWSRGDLSSVEHLHLDLCQVRGRTLETNFVRSLPLNTSITQLTLTVHKPRRHWEKGATNILLGLLHQLSALRKLTLDVIQLHEEAEPEIVELELIRSMKAVNCKHLRWLGTVGTPYLIYPLDLDFLPNLKVYEVRLDYEGDQERIPKYGLTAHVGSAPSVLRRLWEAKVVFLCQHRFIWDRTIGLALCHNQIQYDRMVQWMLDCDYKYFLYSSKSLKSEPYRLDISRVSDRTGARFLTLARSSSCVRNATALAVRLRISDNDSNHAINYIPENTSTLDILLEKRDDPELISNTVSRLGSLRQLVLRFFPPSQIINLAVNLAHVNLGPLTDLGPLNLGPLNLVNLGPVNPGPLNPELSVPGLLFPPPEGLVSPLTLGHQRSFLGAEGRLEHDIVLTDNNRNSMSSDVRVDVYKFDSRTGWWVTGPALDDDSQMGIWHSYNPPLESRVKRIELVFKDFLERNAKLEQVVGYIYGIRGYPLDIV